MHHFTELLDSKDGLVRQKDKVQPCNLNVTAWLKPVLVGFAFQLTNWGRLLKARLTVTICQEVWKPMPSYGSRVTRGDSSPLY